MINSVLREYKSLLIFYTYKCLNHIHTVFSHFLDEFKHINGGIFPRPFFQSIKSYISTCPTDTSTDQRKKKRFIEIKICQADEIILLELLFCFSSGM